MDREGLRTREILSMMRSFSPTEVKYLFCILGFKRRKISMSKAVSF